MPNKSHFARRKAQALPNQTHQPVTLRAAARVAVTAGRKDQARSAPHSIGESFHQQRMTRIYVVMMYRDPRIRAARLPDRSSQGLPLQHMEIKRKWKNEYFLRVRG
jgi:hypothetical protein